MFFIHRQQSDPFTINMGFSQLSGFSRTKYTASSFTRSTSKPISVERSAAKRSPRSEAAGEPAECEWQCSDDTSLLGAKIPGHCTVSLSFIAASDNKHYSYNCGRWHNGRYESSVPSPAFGSDSQHVLIAMPAVERSSRNEYEQFHVEQR